jgi:hypothetical protein
MPVVLGVALATAVLALLDIVALRVLLPRWRQVRMTEGPDRVLAVLAPAAFGVLAFIIPLRAIGPLGLIVSFPSALAGVLFGVAFNVYHFWGRGRWSRHAREAADPHDPVVDEPKRDGFLRRLFP